MKTFADPNSLVQQQRASNAWIVRRVELLRQFGGKIKSSGPSAVVLTGDASALFAQNDTVVVPLDDFEKEYVLNSVTYNAGNDETTLVAVGAWNQNLAGMFVAKRFIVSYGDIERLIQCGNIRFEVEGETLNEFLASDVELVLENGDGFFANSANTGLFDNSDIMWTRIYFGYKLATDRLLYFGGQVDRESIKDARSDMRFSVVCHGHLKELERYPAWTVSDLSGRFTHVQGVTIDAVSQAPGSTVTDGPRKLQFRFPERDMLSGLAIRKIDRKLTAGFHVVKFLPPNLWQLDYGAWQVKATKGEKNTTLLDFAGASITVDMPDEYPIGFEYLLFYVDRGVSESTVAARGTASLQFANGRKQSLIFDFQNILYFDGTTWTEQSAFLQQRLNRAATVMAGASDEIILTSKEKWEAFEITVDPGLVASLKIEYSQGVNAWQALTATDGTSNLSQSGRITFSAPSDWRKTDLRNLSALADVEDVFAIRLSLTSYTSGSAKIYFVRRGMRLSGEQGEILDLKVALDKMPQSGETQEIVLSTDSSGALQYSTWRNNISAHKLISDILTAASYYASNITLDPVKYALSAPALNVYGQMPVARYAKKVTAVAVVPGGPNPFGGPDVPDTVYLGVGDELWKFDELNGVQFLDRLKAYSNATNGDFECDIRRLAIDGAGNLQGVAWKEYDDVLYGNALDISKRTAAIVFRSTDLATITDQTQVDISGNSAFFSGEVCCRDGSVVGSFGDYQVGQYDATQEAGENITLPLPSLMAGLSTSANARLRKQSTLVSVEQNTEQVVGLNRTQTTFVFLPFGNYMVGTLAESGVALGVRFTLGQRGLCEWSDSETAWVFQKWDNFINNLAKLSPTGSITNMVAFSTTGRQVLCGAMNSNGATLYFADMIWDDTGGAFPGDLSTCRLVSSTLGTPGSDVVLFDFSVSDVEASNSLSGTHSTWPKIRSCSVLEMAFNPTENTLHGCVLDRFDFQYHWFVYDITNDKLYSSQTGTGFSFNEGKQLAGFVFNSNDNRVYAVAVDRRGKTQEAELLSADFLATRAAGAEIAIKKESNLIIGEDDLNAGLVTGAGGRVYGVSGPDTNTLFHYDDVFYPQIALADWGDRNMREAITDCAQLANFIINSRANRDVRVVQRGTTSGDLTLYDDGTNIVAVNPIETWRHFYDRVEVAWQDPFRDLKGVEAVGADGYDRRVLKINNRLVQNRHLAKVMAQVYFTFFNQIRQVISAELDALIQLEEFDRIKFIMTGAVDIGQDLWTLQSLDFDNERFVMEMKGLR